MNVLGLRCSTTDFTYAVLSGSQLTPVIDKFDNIPYPRGYSKPLALRWFLHEIEKLIKQYYIRIIVLKSSESRICNKAYEKRIEYETIVFLAATNCGLKDVLKKVKSTIAKDMGLKGRAHYLSTFDTSAIPDFQNYDQKLQEAIFAAWSELH